MFTYLFANETRFAFISYLSKQLPQWYCLRMPPKQKLKNYDNGKGQQAAAKTKRIAVRSTVECYSLFY